MINDMFDKARGFFALLYARLFKINDTPQKIALGFGLGVFSGILPGTGPLAALFLAFIFRVNRASALSASLLTNAWLSFVTFLLAIKIGSAIFKVNWQSLQNDWFVAISHRHGQDLFSASILRIILPVMAGYLVVSLSLGLISYIIVLVILKKQPICSSRLGRR